MKAPKPVILKKRGLLETISFAKIHLQKGRFLFYPPFCGFI